jgi:hypothetical protein
MWGAGTGRNFSVPSILHPFLCPLDLCRVPRCGVFRGSFSCAAKFGQYGFNLSVELVEARDQFVVAGIEAIDDFARRERRIGHSVWPGG